MTRTLSEQSDLIPEPTYLPRVTVRDGRAIEEALAGPTLFDRGVRLDGAVIEATYAATDPPLLKRLREEEVPRLIDPQTLRLAGERFLSVDAFERLPYRPNAPITSNTLTQRDAEALAKRVMRFEQDVGATWYLAAALPNQDQQLDGWLRTNARLLEASCGANGTGDLEQRPLIAQVAPGRKLLAHPELIVNRLLDHPIDAVYVQPLRVDAVRDSVEKLVQYARFLRAIRDQGLPVIASRMGAFGLALAALGVSGFDSGLAQAEAADLAALNRAPTEREQARKNRSGGRRIYIEQLKTTLTAPHAKAILEHRGLRSRFVCTLGCCKHQGFEHLEERARQHYLWVRHHEIGALRAKPTASMRIDLVYELLRDARENATVVRRALTALGPRAPSFDHIERWIAVLARESAVSAAA
jgi:hypothetical protein